MLQATERHVVCDDVRPDLTRQESTELWTVENLRFSKVLGMSPYRINIAREPQDDGSTPPFDGTAELYWLDLDGFRSALASPEGVLAGKDTERFANSVELMVVDEWVV